ncbi:hypothetical protein [Brevibacillus reuszeri]|uniref:hypothetical protein n=1 Tax=Brevibacillus reuszeri TaxID=54915 RepID=UPI000CCC1D3D|nr:hypothetical protein [Brevibacillus reuszeri]
MINAEIDQMVASALELDYLLVENGDVYYKTEQGGYVLFAPTVSWESMGVLVEMAREKGVYLMFDQSEEGYRGQARIINGYTYISFHNNAPFALTLAFLQTQGVFITAMDLT